MSEKSQTMQQLLFVSRSCIDPAIAGLIVSQIVSAAQKRNAQLGVTGSLIYTGECFAEVLEGPQTAISDLMASINRDPRHRSISVLRQSQLKERKFTNWSMAYHGTSNYISNYVTRLMQPASQSVQLKQINELMMLISLFSSVKLSSIPPP